MPQIINTNIASLNAQRNLNATQSDADTALQRLSSGLRINSAKDDAAGLAISERFQSQITGLGMAQRNANDGISLAQTAEGALDEVTANLQRIRELAVQSANASNSNSDRDALNQEVQQRIAEISRIASQTSFNGLRVLDGSLPTQTFQVGANTGETISVSGLDARGSALGSVIGATSGLSAALVSGQSVADIFEAGGTVDFSVELPLLDASGTTVVNVSGASSLEDILGQVNAQTQQTGVTAFLDRENDDIIFSSEFEQAFTVDVTVASATTFNVATTIPGDQVSVNTIDVSSQDGADLAMIATDYAIDQINGLRAELGAVQNRFESTITNLSTTSENLSAANSRIRDADFAAETAELARTQVLQQAGLSVLSQANARPQQVLQLLQG